ncbi:MAG: hypothetical protein LBF68_06500 [Christensenellaceae bacterium]|jgi:hypothetical protein|nr:hypothetical protein [Christensenellaceae bacterium]
MNNLLKIITPCDKFTYKQQNLVEFPLKHKDDEFVTSNITIQILTSDEDVYNEFYSKLDKYFKISYVLVDKNKSLSKLIELSCQDAKCYRCVWMIDSDDVVLNLDLLIELLLKIDNRIIAVLSYLENYSLIKSYYNKYNIITKDLLNESKIYAYLWQLIIPGHVAEFYRARFADDDCHEDQIFHYSITNLPIGTNMLYKTPLFIYNSLTYSDSESRSCARSSLIDKLGFIDKVCKNA